MSMVTGSVQAKTFNAKYGSYGILVNDKWYNSKYEIKAEKGDSVEFDDGGKNYIKGLKVVGKSSTSGGSSAASSSGRSYSRGSFPIPPNDGQRSIIRQNALARSIEALTANGVLANCDSEDLVSTIISTARLFEAYSTGDIDKEAREKMNTNDGFNPDE